MKTIDSSYELNWKTLIGRKYIHNSIRQIERKNYLNSRYTRGHNWTENISNSNIKKYILEKRIQYTTFLIWNFDSCKINFDVVFLFE